MAIDDPQVLVAALETDEGQREPRWLLLLTLLFVLGGLALLVFYAQLPAFFSGFAR